MTVTSVDAEVFGQIQSGGDAAELILVIPLRGRLRIQTCSFIAGSTVGALLFIEVGYLGFILPAVLAGYGMFLAVKYWQKPKTLQSVPQKHSA